jgi:IPT/TIG domain-containing protein
MRFSIDPRTPLPSFRIVWIAVLTLLTSGWTTCSAIFVFNGRDGSIPRITSLSPSTISGETESTVLTVNGRNFAPQSQIMWNGAAVPTTFIDSDTLQTTITQQTFASLGGAGGTGVQISVLSPGSAVSGCSNAESSTTLILVIN